MVSLKMLTAALSVYTVGVAANPVEVMAKRGVAQSGAGVYFCEYPEWTGACETWYGNFGCCKLSPFFLRTISNVEQTVFPGTGTIAFHPSRMRSRTRLIALGTSKYNPEIILWGPASSYISCIAEARS
jgi:hypothetical protein